MFWLKEMSWILSVRMQAMSAIQLFAESLKAEEIVTMQRKIMELAVNGKAINLLQTDANLTEERKRYSHNYGIRLEVFKLNLC